MKAQAPTYTLKKWNLAALTDSPLNARREIENDPETVALAASIKERGMLQDPSVTADGRIIFGHRRIAAARLAGLTELPCRTYGKSLSAIDEQAIRFIENEERKALSPIERANALKAFVDLQTGKTKQKTAAGRLGISETIVSRTLALLELPEWWREAVHNGTASQTEARTVLQAMRLHPPLADHLQVLRLSLPKDISVREWEQKANRCISEQSRMVAPLGSNTPGPLYAHLAVKKIGDQLVTFDVAGWNAANDAAKANAAAQAKPGPKEEEDEEPTKPTEPHIADRRRLARDWFNRRFAEMFQRTPAAHVRWIPILDIPLDTHTAAIRSALALKHPENDPNADVHVIEAVARVKPNNSCSFLANYLKELARLSLEKRTWLVRDWDQTVTLARCLTIDYATEFLPTLTDAEKASIEHLCGKPLAPGKWPAGMAPSAIGVRKL